MYNLGIIGLYKVAPSGGLKRLDECPIKMGTHDNKRNFYPSRDGNMTLTRSYDKRLISLLNFSQYDDEKNYFQLKAWTTKLDPVAIRDGKMVSTIEGTLISVLETVKTESG